MKAWLADQKRIHSEYVLTEDNLWAHEEGTPVLVDLVNGAGAMPTKNWSEGFFEGAKNLNSESFQAIREKKRACYQCSIACRNFHGTEFKGETVRGEGPEYETIALLGANCGIDDIDAAHEDQRALRRARHGHHLDRRRHRPGHGPHREGHRRLRRALRRRRRLCDAARR